MAPSFETLTEQEKKDLDSYAELLRKYVDPEISQYSPIGGRKRPKIKRLESEGVYQERYLLEKKLGVERWGYAGSYKLEMSLLSLSENLRGIECPSFYGIMPINSGRGDILEYLAHEALPKVFAGRKFSVRDTMVPCGDDCSWDCA